MVAVTVVFELQPAVDVDINLIADADVTLNPILATDVEFHIESDSDIES